MKLIWKNSKEMEAVNYFLKKSVRLGSKYTSDIQAFKRKT